MSEGNDIVILPNKNAYVNQKWPNPSEIPYVIDSTFGIYLPFSYSFFFLNLNY
jgi:hypothetical protein